ncbi:glycosyltransferase family A protein [Croceibacterium mercuriale]|uniref:glycosyltransferase family A protein n=1 Tax=Croceibacterium mercuriale TaxID=1572751 RepID=UPI00068C3841|nr:glycosyltransferase family A protein [Croceibacterium mercuriale]
MSAPPPTSPPLITAVMIFRNGEDYIAEAIESILAQSFTGWELVLVDDGSWDGATAIARAFAAAHPARIRYIEHPDHANLGMSASRNAGVAAGRGRYISFLDADDIWLPQRLGMFMDVARQFPEAGMIYGPTLYWYSWAGDGETYLGQEDQPGDMQLPVRTLIPPPVALRKFIQTAGGCLPGICSLLVRRDAYDAVGGFEPSFRGLYEDQVFLSKMTATHPVVVIAEVLDYYRQHAASCCSQALTTGEYDPVGYHPARGTYLRWLQTYLRKIGLDDAVLDHAVARQLRPYSIPGYIPMDKRIRRLWNGAARRIRAVTPGIVLRQWWRLNAWRHARRAGP